MTNPNENGRSEPPVAGDEIATLLGSLDRQRATFAWKCSGLNAAGMRATVGASSITLGGLLKHLALVEVDYFAGRLHGRELGPPWDDVDWSDDRDWEWHSAAADSPEDLLALWQTAVADSRVLVAEALAEGGLDRLAVRAWPDGRSPSLRRTLVDLIEEYARHVGHADLIRESVDGLTGEDPPPTRRPSGSDWVSAFEQVYAQPESSVQARIWAEVLGSDYPRELAPYSYTTWSELRRFVGDLALGPGQVLADIGCGRGGPGLWIAAASGASYVGVDIAEPALAQVRARAARLQLDSVRALRGAFEEIPLGDAEADAIMSVDALLFTPDKRAAAVELARVLRPGGRLVFTTWDYSRQPVGRPPQVPDHRPVLTAAGFLVETYAETPEWERRQRDIDSRLIASVEELANESGENADQVRADLLEMAATVDAMLRRVYVVATRSG